MSLFAKPRTPQPELARDMAFAMHLARPNRTAQGRRSDATRTHTLSKTNKPTCLTAHQPPSTKYSWLKVSRGRLDMPLLDLSIGRPRRVLYWRCCLVSTGLANFFLPGFTRASRALHGALHFTQGTIRPESAVEKTGIEPVTSCLQSRRSTS